MKTYEIITDEALLREFINWLPDCQDYEQYYITLFARKKYVNTLPWVKSDRGQLARKTSRKEFIFDKIAQMECKLGAYKLDGNPVPQEALACYICVNPRDLWKATVRSIGKLATLLECDGKNSNPHQEVMSEIQKCASKKTYIVFDIDEKDPITLQECIDTVDGYCDVTETRGGYHIFVHKDKVEYITDKMWYLKLKRFADVTGDSMTPPWGTYQGGWTPKPIYRMGQ